MQNNRGSYPRPVVTVILLTNNAIVISYYQSIKKLKFNKKYFNNI